MFQEYRMMLMQEIGEIACREPLNIELYIKKRNNYNKFCYEHEFITYIPFIDNELLVNYFIIHSTPKNFIIDNEKKNNAINNLLKCIEINRKGLQAGIDIRDAKIILESVVQLARVKLNKLIDIKEYPLIGFCGKGQALTYYLLEELGLEDDITVNNAINFPDGYQMHGFITVKLPIKEGNTIEKKQYLIDITYNQFFLLNKCYFGIFYKHRSPDPGYFIKRIKGGENFAQSLLENGYVELTLENAYYYGMPFSATSLQLNDLNQNRIKEVFNHTSKEYIASINDISLQRTISIDKYRLFDLSEGPLLYNEIPSLIKEEPLL